MGKFIGETGLLYLWNKIKEYITSFGENIAYIADDDGEGGEAEVSSLPKCIVGEEDGLYQVKDNGVYPVSNPDLSTQWSLLPERFGKYPVYETLIPIEMFQEGSTFTLSKSSAGIYADFLFNSNAIFLDSAWIGRQVCVRQLTLIQSEALNVNAPSLAVDLSDVLYLYIKLAIPINTYYYYNSGATERTIVATFQYTVGNTIISGCNCESIWGTENPDLHVGDVIGTVEILGDIIGTDQIEEGSTVYDLIVRNVGSSVTCDIGDYPSALDLYRTGNSQFTLGGSQNAIINFYSLP